MTAETQDHQRGEFVSTREEAGHVAAKLVAESKVPITIPEGTGFRVRPATIDELASMKKSQKPTPLS